MNKSYWAALILAIGCGYEQPPEETTTVIKTEEKNDEEEKEEEPKTLQEQIAPDWDLTDIAYERNYCTDDFYDYLKDGVYDFCDCLIEKVAMRWTREYWYRYNYTLKKRLAANGQMRRCAVPTEYFPPETAEEIQEDREFDATEATDDGKPLAESIEKAVKTGQNEDN